MIKNFAIIVNDRIIYVSNQKEEADLKFEVVVFANALSNLLSDEKWKLHKIILQPDKSFHKEKILIHQVKNKKHNLDVLYCILGNFSEGSRVGFEILENFQSRIEKVYNAEEFAETVKNNQNSLKQTCDDISYYLERIYIDRIKREDKIHESFNGKPSLLYAGLSCQGLPIVSKMYDPSVLNGNGHSDTVFFETAISGQFATITMNSYIRAKSHVEEIQIIINERQGKFGFINFARIGLNRMYTLELFMLSSSRSYFKKIKKSAERNFKCIQKPFVGELSPYVQIKGYLSKLKS